MPPVKTSDKSSPESDTPKQRKRPGRVPVSCAECRRLKLRCDRKVPCETCTKRGCAALCPDGSLITGGKGTRQAVADVEELKKKIDQLQTRSNALETALRTLQGAVTDEPHPLLQNIEYVLPALNNSSPSADSPTNHEDSQHDEDVLDAFGTLTLGLRGETRFFGQTSRSEYLVHAPERLTANENVQYPRLTKELVEAANMELDVPCRNRDLAKEMMKLLPPLSQSCQMCETFLEYGKYIWYPLPRKYLFDDILSLLYSARDPEHCNVGSTHLLALMWMIYALATLYDLKGPPYAVEAHEYYLLSRLALRFAPPAHETTLTSIQAMIYMAQYLEMSDCEPAHTQSHKAWMTIGHAVKLGHSIGLHMNASRWRLSDEAALQRNRVFWQLLVQDTWISFGFGRPPTINMAFVDCDLHMEPEVFSQEQDTREIDFHVWAWQYTKLLHSIMTTAFAAKAPSYSKVMELDRKVRDFPVPVSLRVQCGLVENPPPTTALIAQRLLGTFLKETTLLNLHRPFFSQALNDMPQDPLKHRYGPSVVAIYRSAWRIFCGARCSYKAIPALSARLGILWSYALSSSIVMCLLVIRAPATTLASSSLQELDKVCQLFEDAAGQSQIASNNLTVMRRLQKQAHDAVNKLHAAEDTVRIHSELERLWGKTYLICPTEERPKAYTENGAGHPSVANPRSTSTPDVMSTSGPSTAPASAAEPLLQSGMIHPTIMQDMRAFDLTGVVDPLLEGMQFNMDFPPTAFDPRQVVDFSAFPEMDFGSGPDMNSSTCGVGLNGSSSGTGVSGSGPDVENMWGLADNANAGPLVLDATWQALVEQLGF